jgi:hypothetical protein
MGAPAPKAVRAIRRTIECQAKFWPVTRIESLLSVPGFIGVNAGSSGCWAASTMSPVQTPPTTLRTFVPLRAASHSLHRDHHICAPPFGNTRSVSTIIIAEKARDVRDGGAERDGLSSTPHSH